MWPFKPKDIVIKSSSKDKRTYRIKRKENGKIIANKLYGSNIKKSTGEKQKNKRNIYWLSLGGHKKKSYSTGKVERLKKKEIKKVGEQISSPTDKHNYKDKLGK